MIRWATVVDVNDPRGRRRVKVRIESVHGPGFPDNSLPWAETAKNGGSPDSGTYPVFVKGQSVLVSCEFNDVTRPAVLAAVTKSSDSGQAYGDTGWAPAGEVDVPLEAVDPTVECVFKTPNGAALLVWEKPGEERVLLVDRLGQYLEMASPTAAAEVGSLKRGDETAPSEEMEALLAGDASVEAVDLSGNRLRLETAADGTSQVVVDNPRNGNSLQFDADGLRVDVLGGQGEGGLTLVLDASGLRLNGVELATRKIVDLLDTFSATVTMSTKPGEPAPMYPAEKAVFDARKAASINSDGMMTKL